MSSLPSADPGRTVTGAAAGTVGHAAADDDLRWRPRVWLRRYLPAEVAATIGAILPAILVAAWWDQPALTALAALIGETIAFYGVVLLTDLRAADRVDRHAVRLLVKQWLIEFGPAEALDTLTRPLALFAAIALIDNAAIGSFVGKVAADVVFYAIAVVGFEVARSRKRHRADQQRGQPGEPGQRGLADGIPAQRSRGGAGDESR